MPSLVEREQSHWLQHVGAADTTANLRLIQLKECDPSTYECLGMSLV